MVRGAGWFFSIVGLVCLMLLWPKAVSTPQDRALPAPLRAAGELKIVVLGTSLTARYDWPAQLETKLAACLDRPVEVETVARPGASVAWGVEQVATVLDLEPDLVLVEFAINDADLRDGVGRNRARELTTYLLAALAAAPAPPQVALMTMSPAQGLRGWLRPELARRYGDYRVLAAAAGTGLVDLYPRWLARPRAERGLGDDGLHPDPGVVAEMIVPVLAEYIGQAAGRSCGAI